MLIPDDGMERPPRDHKAYTTEEDSLIYSLWNTRSMTEIGEMLGRTARGVYTHGRAIGCGRRGRGRFTLTQIGNITGYEPATIRLAASRAGVQGLKTQKAFGNGRRDLGRKVFFTEEQLQRIVQYLKEAPYPNRPNVRSLKGSWLTGNKPAVCKCCHTTERPHTSRGLCDRCYNNARRKNELHKWPRLRMST